MKRAIFFLPLIFSLAYSGEIVIDADSASYELDGARSIFRGNVRVEGAGINLSADSLEVEQDENGARYKAEGAPAEINFQRTDAEKAAAIFASAMTVRYDESRGSISLRGDAVVKTDGVELRAPSADYNLESRTLSADGGAEFTRGNLRATGDSLTATDKGGVLVGNPARLNWRDPEGEEVSAVAATVRFDESSGDVFLSGDAVANRAGESLRGETIQANLNSRAFQADALPGARVRAVIQVDDAEAD